MTETNPTPGVPMGDVVVAVQAWIENATPFDEPQLDALAAGAGGWLILAEQKGFVAGVLATTRDPIPPHQRQALAKIEGSMARIETLFTAVLQMAVERGRLSL